jgi:hypothetical protein
MFFLLIFLNLVIIDILKEVAILIVKLLKRCHFLMILGLVITMFALFLLTMGKTNS